MASVCRRWQMQYKLKQKLSSGEPRVEQSFDCHYWQDNSTRITVFKQKKESQSETFWIIFVTVKTLYLASLAFITQ